MGGRFICELVTFDDNFSHTLWVVWNHVWNNFSFSEVFFHFLFAFRAAIHKFDDILISENSLLFLSLKALKIFSLSQVFWNSTMRCLCVVLFSSIAPDIQPALWSEHSWWSFPGSLHGFFFYHSFLFLFHCSLFLLSFLKF